MRGGPEREVGSTFNLPRAEEVLVSVLDRAGLLGMSWGGEGGRGDEEGCPGGGKCSRTLMQQVRVAPA